MKEGKELFCLCKLYNSVHVADPNYLKRIVKKVIPGNFADFEKICGIDLKNYEFRNWLKELISEEVLVLKEEFPVRKYIFIEDKLLKKIENHPLYSAIFKKPANAIYEKWFRH